MRTVSGGAQVPAQRLGYGYYSVGTLICAG